MERSSNPGNDIAIGMSGSRIRYAQSGLRLPDRQDASRAIEIIEGEIRQVA